MTAQRMTEQRMTEQPPRLSTWEARLGTYLAERRTMPFAWGSNDCALFAAGAVEAMTGSDPAAAFRGAYRSMAGSVRALKQHGAGTLEATIDALFPAIPTGFVRRGDLVWNGEAVGVCVGAVALFVGQEGDAAGLVRVPRAEWVKGWRVG